jgi:hypothetical protein
VRRREVVVGDRYVECAFRPIVITENGRCRSPKTAMAIAENGKPITENGDADHCQTPPGP